MLKQKPIDYGLLLMSLLLYGFLGFVVNRHETLALLSAYFAVFIVYLYTTLKANEHNINFWIYGSILVRGILLFSIPNLSDDFYRFIWDGRLLASGHHPFAEVPSFYIKNNISVPGIDEDLFKKLNSPDYFTIYPPVAQCIFWLSVKVSPQSIYGSLIVMKTIVFIAELGSLLVIKKLLEQLKLPPTCVLLYALNPLILLELSGNLHLEAVLIFFLLLSLLLLSQQRILFSGIAFSFAVCIKLIPLAFLPALFLPLGWKKAFQFYLIIGVTCLVLFLPFWDKDIVFGFQNSLAYYFKKFEFNASIYYLVREAGYWFYGYNIIQTVGWKLGVVSFVLIMIISIASPWKVSRENHPRDTNVQLFNIFTMILLTYFLFTTTLHPWYITTLFALSIFTKFRFALFWTALIFLTYAGYSVSGFQENLWLTAIEYVSVLGYLAYELLWKRNYSSLQASS